jgi:hypothetical protein
VVLGVGHFGKEPLNQKFQDSSVFPSLCWSTIDSNKLMGQQIFQKSVLSSQQSKFMTYYWGFIRLPHICELQHICASMLERWDSFAVLNRLFIWSCCNYNMVVFHLKLSWLPCSALRDVRIPPGPRLLILDHIRRCVDWFTVTWIIHQYSFLFWSMYCCELFNTFRALIILPPRVFELCLLQSLNIYRMVSMIFSNLIWVKQLAVVNLFYWQYGCEHWHSNDNEQNCEGAGQYVSGCCTSEKTLITGIMVMAMPSLCLVRWKKQTFDVTWWILIAGRKNSQETSNLHRHQKRVIAS